MLRPISIAQAAEILGISKQAVLKRIKKGQLLAVPFADKGWMVCHEALLDQIGARVDERTFRKACDGYISVAEASQIVCVTNAMIGRMLADGILDGFRLTKHAWAVSRKSCEDNIREYLASTPKAGRPRIIVQWTRPEGGLDSGISAERLSRVIKSKYRGKKTRRVKRSRRSPSR